MVSIWEANIVQLEKTFICEVLSQINVSSVYSKLGKSPVQICVPSTNNLPDHEHVFLLNVISAQEFFNQSKTY